MYKFFVVVAIFAAVHAGEYQASSYASFNDNHNSVHHIHSAPAPFKYAAPSVYAGPTVTKYVSPAAPVVAKYAAPAVTSYYNAPASHYSTPGVYPAPAVAKVALPVVAKVAPVSYAAPVAKYITGPAYSAHQEEYSPAKYEFAYAIQDSHTGDFHSQEEHRDGDHVVGQYSLHEADGTVRIVKYSDDGHGFNAVVDRQGRPSEAPAVYKKVLGVAAPHYYQ